MNTNPFQKATKERIKLRLALFGASGSGKTYTSLLLASRIAAETGGPLAVIDTEYGRARHFADRFDFDAMELTSFDPRRYVEAIHAAEQAGYAAVVIDSLSHAWDGKDGALELVDRAKTRHQNSTFNAWGDITPIHQSLIDAIVRSPLHVIATLRAETKYVQEKDANGKTVIRSLGETPVQRKNFEYEFTFVGRMDEKHSLVVLKSPLPELDEAIIARPDTTVADTLLRWLNDGAPPDPKASTAGSASEPSPSAAPPKTAPATTPSPSSAPRMTQARVIEDMNKALDGSKATDDIADRDSIDNEVARRSFWGGATRLGYVNADGKLLKSAVHRAFGVAERDGALGEYLEAEHKGWGWAKTELARITAANRADAAQPALEGMPAVERERPEAAAGAH